MRAFIDTVRQALQLADIDPRQAQAEMTPLPRPQVRPSRLAGEPRLGAVLLLLFGRQEIPHLVLTRRRDDMNAHAGQISFPGGRNEAPEALLATALREAEEEIGVLADEIQILGQLNQLYIPPTDYEVHPFVAWHAGQPRFRPAPEEVAELLEVPVPFLLDPANRHEEAWNLRGHEVQVPFFLVNGHKVWGATAMMLSEFLVRLRQFGPLTF